MKTYPLVGNGQAIIQWTCDKVSLLRSCYRSCVAWVSDSVRQSLIVTVVIRTLCDTGDQFSSDSAEVYTGLFINFQSQMFPLLSYFISCIFCLPHSSAAAERIFSAVNNIKTKQRNSLTTKTLVGLLHSKRYLKDNSCFSFLVNNTLIGRMTSDMYDSEWYS